MSAIIRFCDSQSWWQKLITLIEIGRQIKNFPQPNKGNTVCVNSRRMLDISERFFKLLDMPNRDILFKKVYQLMIDEFEHDGVYSSVRDWWIEEIIKSILDGKWQARPDGWPLKKWWSEEEPYGGVHSIVHRMIEKRKEINAILEVGCNE